MWIGLESNWIIVNRRQDKPKRTRNTLMINNANISLPPEKTKKINNQKGHSERGYANRSVALGG